MLTLLFLIALYFLPTIVASQRGVYAGGIGVLNALFGWTGIGWAALLVWALVAQPMYAFHAGPAYPAAYPGAGYSGAAYSGGLYRRW